MEEWTQATDKIRNISVSSEAFLPFAFARYIYMAYEYLEHDLNFTRLRPSCGRRVSTLGWLGPNKSALHLSQSLPSDTMTSSRFATGAKEAVRVKLV
jgi:hypothetical protein